MRYLILMLVLLLCPLSAAASTQVSVGIAMPGLSIGVNVPAYPQLVRVPGYPVYYAPQLPANYFFYDGMYWVYSDDDWYVSNWYNGPWDRVYPQYVPRYILRIPVHYYRRPPQYFHGWRRDAPPRWDRHWGRDWARDRHDWDRWDRRAAPAPAPLPGYQRQYSGERYPDARRQPELQRQFYRHAPADIEVRQQGWRQSGRGERGGSDHGRGHHEQDDRDGD